MNIYSSQNIHQGAPSVLNCGVYALWAIPFAYSPPHKSLLSPTEKLKGAFIAPQNTLPLSYSPVSMFTGERQTLANGGISQQRFLGRDTAPQTLLEESLADSSRGQLHPVLRFHLRSQLWRSETTVTKALPDQDPILVLAALAQWYDSYQGSSRSGSDPGARSSGAVRRRLPRLFQIRIRSWRSQLWCSETTVTKALPSGSGSDRGVALAALAQWDDGYQGSSGSDPGARSSGAVRRRLPRLFRIRIRSWRGVALAALAQWDDGYQGSSGSGSDPGVASRSQLWRSETTVTKALPDQDPILASSTSADHSSACRPPSPSGGVCARFWTTSCRIYQVLCQLPGNCSLPLPASVLGFASRHQPYGRAASSTPFIKISNFVTTNIKNVK